VKNDGSHDGNAGLTWNEVEKVELSGRRRLT
jgi:hypothetical protein